MKRYSKQVGFDKEHEEEMRRIVLAFNDSNEYRKTKHAVEQMKLRFDLFEVGSFLNKVEFKFEDMFEYYFEDMFEYYFEDGKVSKVLFEIEYNETELIKIVLDRNKTLISVWRNAKNNNHLALDTSVYEKV